MTEPATFQAGPLPKNIFDQPNTLFPNEPGYQRPDRADDYQPTKPFVAAVTATGTAAEQAHAAMEHAADAHAKYLAKLNEDRDRYSATGYAQQAALFGETSAAKAVDNAVAQVQARVDQAEVEVAKVRESLTRPGDAAQESRNSRYWNRTKAVLDTIEKGGKFNEAEALLKHASRDELSVLLEELPAYMRQHLGPMPKSFQHATGMPADTDWADWIDTVYVTRAVPEYGRATQQLKKAKQALIITESNARRLRERFAKGAAAGARSAPVHNYDPDK